mgnify:CR=1 FL=1
MGTNRIPAAPAPGEWPRPASPALLETLEENDWNISRTAQLLGIERTNLHKKIKAYGIKVS